MRRYLSWIAGLFLLLSAGCQKTEIEQTITIARDQEQALVKFEAPGREQKTQIAVKSENGPVNAYLVLVDDLGEVVTSLRDGRTPRKALDQLKEAREGALEATIPANKPFIVLLQPAEMGKEVKVNLKVSEK